MVCLRINCLFRMVFIILLVGTVFVSVLNAREVIVGLYDNPPTIFRDETGKPSGIFIEIIEYIAELEEWKLQYVDVTWNQGLEFLDESKIDLMPDVAYTKERAEIFDFHQVPVLSSWSQVFAKRGSEIRSLLDLDGKTVTLLEGSVHYDAFFDLLSAFDLNVEVRPYESIEQSFQALVNGEAEATIVNYFYGMMNLDKFGLENTSVVFNPSQLYYAAPKNLNRDLLTAIDKHLSSIKTDDRSVYYQTLRKWTDRDFRYRLPGWVVYIAVVTILFLLLSIAMTLIFKRQVNVKTAELRLSNREMELKIKERTSELANALNEAEAADRIKSAFLATMSHELRTPLNSIIGFSGILLQELAGPLNQEQRKQLNIVKKNSNHLLDLINDILDLSKIEAGQLNLAYSKFSLRESILNVSKIIMPIIDDKGLELKIEIADEVGEIWSDKRRIEQILLNLFSNAVKFTEQGQVKLECKIEQGNCYLKVIDSGIGISSKDQKNLFKPFSQLDMGLSRKYEGTGLGLSICCKLIEMLKGTILLNSEPGKGSEFLVIFPVAADSEVEG